MRRVLVLSLVALSLLVPLGCAKKKASVPLDDPPSPQAPEREFELRRQPRRLQIQRLDQPVPPVEQSEPAERLESDPQPAK